ncbi:MAG TPA: D-sedoheptulose 7-phosphate isomerase [Ignavibacteria bacterium]|nr:D-sedoheptulose 7-phosphate isomerase [Ignavibacteria bacterium]
MDKSVALVRDNFLEAKKILDEFLFDTENLEKISKAGKVMVNALKKGNKIISCGNGGSMCDAMHFAEELTGRFKDNRKPIAAISISDASHISCVGNDYGYEQVFSRYITAIGKPGDVLLAISTSGNSGNILKGIESAKNKKMKVVGLTGKDGGKMEGLCDVEIRAPKSKYSDRAQEIHIKVIHSLIDFIEKFLK